MPDSNDAEPLRVVVADDDRLTALSLADSLRLQGFHVEGVAHTAGNAIALVAEKQPDVLVVDLDFGPGPSGLDVAERARRTQPSLGVVMLSAYEDPRLLGPKLPRPPAGTIYLVKQKLEDPAEVANAARQAVAQAGMKASKSVHSKAVKLTDSQIELLRLIAAGLSNPAIAQSLNLTPESVKKSISRLSKKLGVDASSDSNLRVALTHRYLDFSGHNRA